jgi:hypothetical protein
VTGNHRRLATWPVLRPGRSDRGSAGAAIGRGVGVAGLGPAGMRSHGIADGGPAP